jgi:hypothetical protein
MVASHRATRTSAGLLGVMIPKGRRTGSVGGVLLDLAGEFWDLEPVALAAGLVEDAEVAHGFPRQGHGGRHDGSVEGPTGMVVQSMADQKLAKWWDVPLHRFGPGRP